MILEIKQKNKQLVVERKFLYSISREYEELSLKLNSYPQKMKVNIGIFVQINLVYPP
jgi:hypothetical protein